MLKFKAAFRVTPQKANYSYIALGVRPDPSLKSIMFLVPGSYPKTVTGTLKDTDAESALLIPPEGSKNPALLFEYLTVERFREMAKDISGFQNIEDDLKTTEDVQEFYVNNFLDESWVQAYLQFKDALDET